MLAYMTDAGMRHDEGVPTKRASAATIPAGNSASVLTLGLSVLKVCLNPLLHHEACEAN